MKLYHCTANGVNSHFSCFVVADYQPEAEAKFLKVIYNNKESYGSSTVVEVEVPGYEINVRKL